MANVEKIKELLKKEEEKKPGDLIAEFIFKVLLGPFLVIWCLNNLAQQELLEYGFWNWFYVGLIMGFIKNK